MICMFILVSFLLVDAKKARIIVQVVVMVCNYLFSKFFVFKKIDR